METLTKQIEEVLGRLRSTQEELAVIKEAVSLLAAERSVKEWYSTAQAAAILGKAEFTVREWCRQHRIYSTKQLSGRGAFQSYAISHKELLRIQKEGLLPANHQLRNGR